MLGKHVQTMTMELIVFALTLLCVCTVFATYFIIMNNV